MTDATAAAAQLNFREKGDPNRWIVLTLISFYTCSNAIQWVTYAPVASSSKEFFHFNTDQLNMMSTIYMIVYVIGAVFTCTTFERWGLRSSVIIGTGLNALGAILKFAPGLEYPCYTSTIIPQVINSLSQLFVLSTPPLVAAQYFPPHRRAFATAVAATSNTVGYALWMVVPPLIVTEPDKRQFQILFGIQLAMCVGVFLGVLFLFKPPQYSPPIAELLPSNGAASQPEGEEEPELVADVDGKGEFPYGGVEGSTFASGTNGTTTLSKPANTNSSPMDPTMTSSDEAAARANGSCWSRFRNSQEIVIFVEVLHTCLTLAKNRDFVFLFWSFSIGTGSIWSFFGVLAQISAPVGVSEVQAGISGSVSVVGATILAYLVGFWVDRTHRYKLPVVICFGGSVLGWIALIVVLLKAPANTALTDGLCIAMFIFSGLFQSTAIPICFEFALELTYPVRESVPGALLMAGANLISLTLMFVVSAIMGNGDVTLKASVYCVVLYVSICAVGTVLAILPREKLARLEAEHRLVEEQERVSGEPLALPDADQEWIDNGIEEEEEQERKE